MNGKWIQKPRDENQFSIVFVHGHLPRGETYWQNKNGTYWPALLKNEKGLGNAGIYVFNYHDLDILNKPANLEKAVELLKNMFKKDHLLSSRRIVLVCHGLGGIIAKQFLVLHQKRFIENNIGIGLFLMSSPFLESKYEQWFWWLTSILGNFSTNMQQVSKNNNWLNRLDLNFKKLIRDTYFIIKGRELIEDEFILPKGPLKEHKIDFFYGEQYFGEAYRIDHSNFFTIAKPSNKLATQYQLLYEFIDELKQFFANSLDKNNQCDLSKYSNLKIVNPSDIQISSNGKLVVTLNRLFCNSSQIEKNQFIQIFDKLLRAKGALTIKKNGETLRSKIPPSLNNSDSSQRIDIVVTIDRALEDYSEKEQANFFRNFDELLSTRGQFTIKKIRLFSL